MLVGMVDTSTLEGVLRASARRRQPVAEPPNQTRTRGNDRGGFSNFVRNVNPFAMMGAVNSSLVRPTGERAAQGYFPETFEAEDPGVREAAMDLGMNAAGGLAGGVVGRGVGAGLKGAAPLFDDAAKNALETGEAIAARRQAIERLLNDEGPLAINQFLNNPLTGYLGTLNWGTLNRFFRETPERIPRGTEMFRAPSKGEVQSRLPREIGAVYAPGTVRSAGGPADLQKLGAVLEGKTLDSITGGNQSYAPGLASITAMDDLPGILDINEFLARYAGRYGGQGRPAIAPTSKFNVESVLGPQVRYSVRDFQPGVNGVPPTWYLNAYSR
jgi:hypothetical protein